MVDISGVKTAESPIQIDIDQLTDLVVVDALCLVGVDQ